MRILLIGGSKSGKSHLAQQLCRSLGGPLVYWATMEPVDPVVTDHLGDVYWAVGRKLEAQFQWRRALSYDPEEKDAIRIRRKLELGLDKVLAEEGAAPLETRNAANDN